MASRSSNKAAVPEAKAALDKFKYEVASELGVPLKDGYNGDLTSRQNGKGLERVPFLMKSIKFDKIDWYSYNKQEKLYVKRVKICE